jgi:stage II sporulation protein D
MLFCWLGASPTPSTAVSSKTNLELIPRVRPVRVLIASDVPQLRLDSEAPVRVLLADRQPLHRFASFSQALVEPLPDGTLEIAGRSYPAGAVFLQPEMSGTLRLSTQTPSGWSAPLEYEGLLRISVNRAGRLDAVNEIELERYVASVAANEVWPTFHDESYRAQTIISRTYALYQMMRRPNADADLTATQGSQVYRGVRRDETGQRARAAAEYTRGIALTYRDDSGADQLFCTYYSAACGGSSQPAAGLGPESDVPPLRGDVICDYCRIAPGETYRWGPVTLRAEDFLSRLSARYPGMASLAPLADIEVVERSPRGRPVRWRLWGSEGKSVEILAERLRLALDGAVVRSTDCRIRLADGTVVFEDGKGFGHGLGLCQWGMEGQARTGRSAGEILLYYYPGAVLTKVY